MSLTHESHGALAHEHGAHGNHAHEHAGLEHWLDRWWFLLLIAFGIAFVLFLAMFPQN